MKIQSTRQRLLATSVFCGAAFALAVPALAQAQTAAEAPAAAPQEVVVTGSRISRQDYVADTPIVTVGQTQLQQSGAITVETLLNSMPQFVPGSTATSNNPPNGGEAQVELRGLGVQRTLVLIDGRRAQPSNADNSVDLNSIPDALIENIEVITGGASATYGSDAIAGVVNFKLKKHFTGVEADAQYGETGQGDGATQAYSVTMGSDFADHRGNAVLSLAYSQRDQIFNSARGFAEVSGASGTTPYGTMAHILGNEPSQAAIDAVFAKYGIPAGTIDPTKPFGFNTDGTVFSQVPGGPNFRGDKTSPDTATLATLGSYNTGALNLLVTPLTRYNAFTRVNYDINSHITAYGQFSFTHYSSNQQLAPSPEAGDPTAGGTGYFVPVTNPFIPADLSTLLASRPNSTADFLISDRATNLGPRVDSFTYNDYQFLIGLKGDVPNTDWTWDLYGSFGRADSTEIQAGNVVRSVVLQLLDAPDGGASICAGGFNPFGFHAVSAACRALISPLTHNVSDAEQREVQFSVQGSLFDLPAGKLKFAAGADYRRNAFDFSPDNLLNSTATDGGPGVAGFNFGPPVDGATDVYELFGELYVPILRDLPFVKSLSADLGYRYSDYGAGAAAVGGVSTWKATGVWDIAAGFTLRGGYEHAIRAPSVAELFLPAAEDFPAIGKPGVNSGDPCDIRTSYRTGANAAQVRALCIAQGISSANVDQYEELNTQVNGTLSGNPNLGAETANTFSVGMVWAPRFSNPLFHRLSASVDYYNIKITGAVAKFPGSTTLQKCFNADGSNPTYSNTNAFCQLITRSTNTGEVANLQEPLSNLQNIKTSGVDFQLDWAFGLGAVGWSDHAGSISLNVVGNYLTDFSIQAMPGLPYTDLTGTIGDNTIDNFATAHPKWKTTTSLTYSYGPFDITGRWQFIDSMEDVTTTTGAKNAVGTPSVNYFDLLMHWRINETLELRFGINNLTDKQPPTFTSADNFQANTDPGTYDVYGRRYFVGLKARF